MVSLKNIRAANASIERKSQTAVFVGATSGIGLGTIEALLQHTEAPTVIFIGRSKSKFAPTLSRLQSLNAKATLTFIEAQVSLLKEVDRVCSIIAAKHDAIDYLWLSQGGLATGTGSLSLEGLHDDLAISFYSRMLFMQRLIPLLNKSKTGDARIVSVLSAGQEGDIKTSDLGLQQDAKDFGVFPTMKHNVTLMSLSMNELARQNPNIAFLHTNPGMVSTKVHDTWLDGWTGPWTVVGWIMKWTVIPFFHRLGFTPEEAGQVGFYELTGSRFAAKSGTNFFRLSENAEVVNGSKVLQKYENDGFGSKVLDHVLQVSEKVLSQ